MTAWNTNQHRPWDDVPAGQRGYIDTRRHVTTQGPALVPWHGPHCQEPTCRLDAPALDAAMSNAPALPDVEVKAQIIAWAVMEWWHMVRSPLDPARYVAETAHQRLGVDGGGYERVRALVDCWLAETGLLAMSAADAESYRDAWRASCRDAVAAADAAARAKDWPACLVALDALCAIDPGCRVAGGQDARTVRAKIAAKV